MATAPESEANFLRSLIKLGGRILFESTCVHCGATLVGSVTDGLPYLEVDHLQRRHGIIARPATD